MCYAPHEAAYADLLADAGGGFLDSLCDSLVTVLQERLVQESPRLQGLRDATLHNLEPAGKSMYNGYQIAWPGN